jgi:uncharacterized RDD family membrane protein YckC
MSWPDFYLMESFRKQSTLGKQTLGIKVTNLEGKSYL